MIKAKVVADSISPQGIRLTTFEIEVPRIVWAEFLTHGMLCRNAASSRAIPFNKMQDQLTGKPVRFGKAMKGMTDAGEHFELIEGKYTADEWWNMAKESAQKFSKGFYDAGYAKQIFNRPVETYQMIKAVVTATEYDNFFWLRKHSAADPTIERLAQCMWEAKNQSSPQELKSGEWHLPYVSSYKDNKGEIHYGDCTPSFYEYTLEQAIKVSCARTAAVSFRNEDYGLEKCLEVYDRLVGDERKHASAMQHQATPMKEAYEGYTWDKSVNLTDIFDTWEPGVSHVDRDGQLWSAQFKGWIMYRKLIPGENYTGEIE